MNELIRLDNIGKSYGDHEVLSDISLSIRENEFVTLLGPSGCGKTTTLRIIGGFETPDIGKVIFDGKDITLSLIHIYLALRLGRPTDTLEDPPNKNHRPNQGGGQSIFYMR